MTDTLLEPYAQQRADIAPHIAPELKRSRWPRQRVRSMLRDWRKSLQKFVSARVYANKPLSKRETSALAFFVAEIATLCYRGGSTLANFRRAAPQVAPYFVITDATARKALRELRRLKTWREECGETYRPSSAAKVGEELGVTAQACEELDLKTIRPAGWTPELAAADRKARKLERDRKRWANASAKDRQREAKRKRVSRAHPWSRPSRAAEAQRKREEIAASGRSRATWYRRRETDGVRETKRVRVPILPARERGRRLSHRTTNGKRGPSERGARGAATAGAGRAPQSTGRRAKVQKPEVRTSNVVVHLTAVGIGGVQKQPEMQR